MGTDSCIIRNYCSADLEKYVRFYSEAESICHSRDAFLLASLSGESGGPVDFSERNLFLAEEEGTIVGACRVVPEPPIDRAVLRLFVARGSRGSGIAARLLCVALGRIRDLGTERVHADLREQDSAARNLFARLGFRPVRRYTEMMLALGSVSIVEPEHGGVTLRQLEGGREAEFTRLQNHVFAGSWGFCPNTTPEIVQQLDTQGYHHENVIVAYQGEQAVGYCWTAELPQPDYTRGAAVGRIHMMGVVPEFRNFGFGRHLLWSGLQRLASKGIHTVELTVDNENGPACLLYERAGFKLKTALLWYEKEIEIR